MSIAYNLQLRHFSNEMLIIKISHKRNKQSVKGTRKLL
jgi:hypothetical protein